MGVGSSLTNIEKILVGCLPRNINFPRHTYIHTSLSLIFCQMYIILNVALFYYGVLSLSLLYNIHEKIYKKEFNTTTWLSGLLTS